MTINNHNFDDGDLLATSVGFVGSLWAQVTLFGIDILRASILAAVGATVTYLVKRFWDKFFNGKKTK